jgi:hypothetical protein
MLILEKKGQVDECLAYFLAVFRTSLTSSRPREVTASWDSPLFVFTDASFNPDDASWKCGLGECLLTLGGHKLRRCLTDAALDSLGYPGKFTLIFEAELLALLVCFTTWKKQLRDRPAVFFIDNNATRDVSISGRARTYPGSSLIADLLSLEDPAGVNAWYARVCLSSNVADGPSRGSSDGIKIKFLPEKFVELVVDKVMNKVCPPKNLACSVTG